jgi:hypothetical protein
MSKPIGLLSIVGFLGLLASANAQTAPPTTGGTPFDGTYQLVSSTRANAMATEVTGQMTRCPDRTPGPLHIVGGRADFTTDTGNQLTGRVGPQGVVTMRSTNMVGGARPAHLQASGTVDASGTAHILQKGSSCSYDYVWRKQS